MPLAETVRFASLRAQVLAESTHNPEGNNALLISTSVKIREISNAFATIRLVDESTRSVLEEQPLGPDGSGGLHLGLYAFKPPSNRPFRVQLTSSGGAATGYLTIVHPVTAQTLDAIRSSRDVPLTVPAQIARPEIPTALAKPRELIPLVAEGTDVCEVHPANKNIEPIFFRRVCTTNFMSSVIPSRNSDMQAIPF